MREYSEEAINNAALLLGVDGYELAGALNIGEACSIEEIVVAECFDYSCGNFRNQFGVELGSPFGYPGTDQRLKEYEEDATDELLFEQHGIRIEDLEDMRQQFKDGLLDTPEEKMTITEQTRNLIRVESDHRDEIEESARRRVLLGQIAGWLAHLAGSVESGVIDIVSFAKAEVEGAEFMICEDFELQQELQTSVKNGLVERILAAYGLTQGIDAPVLKTLENTL